MFLTDHMTDHMTDHNALVGHKVITCAGHPCMGGGIAVAALNNENCMHYKYGESLLACNEDKICS